ncbi:MAG: DUF2334 domain-containing protein [Polyangiales bacterium]|nr:DUF2334 domain-containing protein [Myxococcales bacterium]
MRYVIFRDDDANALTPPHMLERLYRPLLDRGMTVHLATIPEVRTDIRDREGNVEGFLVGPDAGSPGARAVGENTALVDYVTHEPGYRVVQHGLRHEFVDGHYEFERDDAEDIIARLERGTMLLTEAGFPKAATFVAPQDKLSRVALVEAARRFPVVSTGWYDLGKVPPLAWPQYLWAKKVRRSSHWRTGKNLFLSHPGCILSYRRTVDSILADLQAQVLSRSLTVVVSHHWEYFRNGSADEPYIAVLHAFAEWLANERSVRVITFDEALELAP